MTRAVVFDLDGVLIDSEQVWDDVREGLARERGGHWHEGAQRDMMGMSSPEWSRYMHDRIGLRESPEEINRIVVERMLERYKDGPPWLPGALDAVRRLAEAFVLGLASSSNRELIDVVLEAGGIADLFKATVSSEEVAAGKPAPDVYLEAARRLGVESGAVHRSRGLAQRDPVGKGGGDAVRRDPEPAVPARRRRRRGGSRARLAGGAHGRRPPVTGNTTARRQAGRRRQCHRNTAS